MTHSKKWIPALICLLALLCGCSASESHENSEAEASAAEATAETAPAETAEEGTTVDTETEAEEVSLVGVWNGDGTMDITGLEHEIEFVNVWTFNSDGTAKAEKDLEDGTTETLEFTYTYTDDTLTFTKDGGTCSVTYTLDGDTLSFRTGVDTYAVFTRQ